MSAKRAASIKRLSIIIRILVGIAVGGYLALLLFTASPWAGRWMAQKVATTLSRELNTEVQVGHIQLGLFNRIVIDDLLLLDQENDTLLAAARLSAKVDPWLLLKGQYHIVNAQLFGYDIRLRRPSPEKPYNFQFIIDQLSSEDSTSTPLDLKVESVIARRGRLSHQSSSDVPTDPDRQSLQELTNFNLEDLALYLSIKASDQKGINLSLRELRFRDSRSGLIVENLSAQAFVTQASNEVKRIFISNLNLQLPASNLQVPRLVVNVPFTSFRAITNGHLTPADLAPILPLLDRMPAPLDYSTQVDYEEQQWNIPRLSVKSEELDIRARGDVSGNGFDAAFQQCHIGNRWLQYALQTLQELGTLTPDVAEKLLPLGEVDIQGNLSYQPEQSDAELKLNTLLGEAKLQATMQNQDEFTATLQASVEDIKPLAGDVPILSQLQNLSFHVETDGSIQKKNVHAHVLASEHSSQGEPVTQLNTEFRLSPQSLQATLHLSHPELSGNMDAAVQSSQEVSLSTEALEQLTGQVNFSDLHFRHDKHLLALKELRVSVDNDDDGHHLLINGDCINAKADGHFQYTTIAATGQQLLHGALPSLIPQPSEPLMTDQDKMDFNLRLWKTDSLFSMLGVDLRLPQSVSIEGHLDGEHKQFTLNADAPNMEVGGEDLRAVTLIARQQGDYLRSFVSLQRWMEGAPFHITLTSEAEQDRLETFVTWEGEDASALRGQLSAKTLFHHDDQQHLEADIHLNPSQIVIADTVWNVQEADLAIRTEHIDVQNFKVAQQGRYLQIDGVISNHPTDTLHAALRGINLEYVFGLLDFHDVELAGVATGVITANSLMTEPVVNASLDIRNFHFENTPLGHLNVTGGWGRVAPGSIDLDGWITEPLRHLPTHVHGTITPGHGPHSGLDLDVQAQNLNAGFVTEYASGIFQDFIGRASGHARIHGPFSELDLDGALAMDTLALTIGTLGTRYHSLGGDSVWLGPEGVRVQGFQVYDQLHGTDNRAHHAVVDGQLMWQHFDNIRYAFDITADNLLGYDFRDFGDEVFYATIFASGTCRLTGNADRLDVDLHGSPNMGSVLTYNASTPETLTNNQFITFVNSPTAQDSDSPPALPVREGAVTYDSEGKPSSLIHSAPSLTGRAGGESKTVEEPSTGLDIYISFDVQVTPEAQIRLLMDPRSEDYITLYGNGGIRATYHNNGRFQMYGTYHVNRGTYRLTLQEVIRKEFLFQQGGTIVFGGAPMKAGLNLQAVYTVPSVSLNDLAAGSNFSASNVRVNCLMNIGGLAEQPQVSFDFDIPNVNEDEKQMVRSLISTDEERNLQVIYLLGIGRFYTYGLSENQSQTNTAMQSLLSSTLSGQLNDILANTIGNQNWNFGTNLSTGTQGWSDMDVEGMLSGRLLDNRLLINGTFGYRDTPVANTNFIGDFDLQYLLTPSGALSLKAYSQTNDRYFTKTALTTQGIGIRLHKDFSNLRELFHKNK